MNIDGSEPDRLPLPGALWHERSQCSVGSKGENETRYPETWNL